MSTNENSAPQPNVSGLEIGPDGRVECPECHQRIGAGVAGMSNLVRHMESKNCKELARKFKAKQRKGMAEKQQTLVKSYFTAPSKVPPTVSAPLRIHSTMATTVPGPASKSADNLIPQSIPQSISASLVDTVQDIDSQSSSLGSSQSCPIGMACLAKLRARIIDIDANLTIPEAGETHELAAFSGDPTGCVPDGEDAWETWDGPLNTLLQREPSDLRKLIVRGEKGLAGLHQFLLYLVTNHGIQGALIEGKIDRLIAAMDEV